jgi:hypothetical protein
MYCSVKKSAVVCICGALLVINIVTDNYGIKLMGLEFVPEVAYIIISRFISRIFLLISLASIANYNPAACIIVNVLSSTSIFQTIHLLFLPWIVSRTYGLSTKVLIMGHGMDKLV